MLRCSFFHYITFLSVLYHTVQYIRDILMALWKDFFFKDWQFGSVNGFEEKRRQAEREKEEGTD